MLHLSLLLRPEARSLSAIAQVEQAAEAIGMEPIASGRATVSCQVSKEKYAELFGTLPRAIPARPKEQLDAGAPGGFVETILPVPPSLVNWVESLSITPPATRYYRA